MVPDTNRAIDLVKLRSGRRDSLDELTVLLYDELREIAHRHRALGVTVRTVERNWAKARILLSEVLAT